MIWQRKILRPLETIARTGFLVSLTSYVLFWGADLLEPGFVSRYFSVHLFLLAAIVFGVGWSACVEEYVDRPWVQRLVVLAFAVLSAVLTWGLSQDLGLYRVPVLLLAFAMPFVVYSLIRS